MARGLSRIMIILLFAGFMLSACFNGDSTTKVRVGEVTRSIFYAPQYVALSQGFFKEEGLSIELITTSGGDKTMTALLSGGIDIGLVGAETSIYVYQQGTDDPAINFAQVTQTDGTFLVSRKANGQFDWNSLKGASYLGQRKGGMPQMTGEYSLQKHGINPKKDINLIQNVDFANIASAFSSGTGDYVQLFEPQATVFEREGRGYVVASFGTESGKLPYTVYMSRQSFIKKNEEMIQKFTNAIYKAQKWIVDRSVNEIADAIAPYFKDTEIEIIRNVVQRYKSQDTYANTPYIDQEEWDHLQEIMTMAGELKQHIDWSKLVDNSYAEEARKSIK